MINIMAEDLLAREREFHRLNKELNEKTQELMKEVDLVINNQKNISYRPPSGNRCRSNSVIDTYTKNNCSQSTFSALGRPTSSPGLSSPQVLESHVKGVLTNCNLINPITFENGDKKENDSIQQFLKAKIKMLQTEIEHLQLEFKKKCSQCKNLESENKKQEEMREKLYNQIALLKETNAKSENSCSNLQEKLHDQNTEIIALKKEIEGLKKDHKTFNQQVISYDLRLNRSLEENDRLRNNLKLSQQEEKELRDQIRKSQEEKKQAIRNLEKQRSELFQAFKKQSMLVDNLKRQKAFLEANKGMHLLEEDFTKLLDWKPDNI